MARWSGVVAVAPDAPVWIPTYAGMTVPAQSHSPRASPFPRSRALREDAEHRPQFRIGVAGGLVGEGRVGGEAEHIRRAEHDARREAERLERRGDLLHFAHPAAGAARHFSR